MVVLWDLIWPMANNFPTFLRKLIKGILAKAESREVRQDLTISAGPADPTEGNGSRHFWKRWHISSLASWRRNSILLSLMRAAVGVFCFPLPVLSPG
jgi:hypothetical protein